MKNKILFWIRSIGLLVALGFTSFTMNGLKNVIWAIATLVFLILMIVFTFFQMVRYKECAYDESYNWVGIMANFLSLLILGRAFFDPTLIKTGSVAYSFVDASIFYIMLSYVLLTIYTVILMKGATVYQEKEVEISDILEEKERRTPEENIEIVDIF